MEETILAIRDDPPEGLRRTPGPRTINYYLQRDATLQALGLAGSRSTRTIYQILLKHQRIVPRKPREREPVERPEPMTHWQIDYKDISSVPGDPDGKKQHGTQSFNIVDMGTSMIVAAHVRSDFTAETTIRALGETFQTHGRPDGITMDRDTRLVGSPQGSDFPSAMLRFCACLNIEVQVCDPHHPQQNGFVERFNRSYKEECLLVDRPRTRRASAGSHRQLLRPLQPRTAQPGDQLR